MPVQDHAVARPRWQTALAGRSECVLCSLEYSEPHPVQRPQVGMVGDRGYARTA